MPTRTTPNPVEVPAPPPATPENLIGAVEAVLLCAERSLGPGRIAEIVRTAYGLPEAALDAGGVDEAVRGLNEQYAASDRSFRIEKVAGGLRLMTVPEYAPVAACLRGAAKESKLSRAALETLAIVAYRQPATRAELEAIRGVACGDVLRSLLDKRLIVMAGRADEPGRPILYGTSRRFLEVFGLRSVKDLPAVEALEQPPSKPPAQEPSEAAPPATASADAASADAQGAPE